MAFTWVSPGHPHTVRAVTEGSQDEQGEQDYLKLFNNFKFHLS